MGHLYFMFVWIHIIYAKKHSLQYFYTATSGLQNFPKFVTVGALDGQPFTYYDSDIRTETPRQEWMAKSVEEDYWEKQTNISLMAENIFKTNLDIVKERFNQTEGVHTVQRMYGCEWDDETTETKGFREEGYDGEDLLALDFKEMRYVSPMQQGFTTQQSWNNYKAYLEDDENYLSNECIEWLKKYLEYGKSSLMKKVSPQVSLLQKSFSCLVMCHATGFYPTGIKISWQKNGQDYDEDVELGELLPNADGTFQKTSTLNVKPEEWKNNKFRCVVEHQGETKAADETILTNKDSLPIGFIAGVVAALVLLVVICFARYMVYQKEKGFKPVSGYDDGSNSFAHSSKIIKMRPDMWER